MFTQKKFFILIISLLTFASLSAQSVQWRPYGGTLAINQNNELSLIFEDCAPSDNFSLPKIDNLQFVQGPFMGSSTSTSVDNGRVTTRRTTTLSYQVRPVKKAPVEIPSFSVKTDRGNITVPMASFSVDINAAPPGTAPGHLANTTVPIQSLAKSSIFTPKTEVWENEVFPLAYQMNVHKNYARSVDNMSWDSTPLILEDWSQATQEDKRIDGEPRVVLMQASRALIPKGNTTVSTEAPMQNVTFAVGAPQRVSPFDMFNIGMQVPMETYTIVGEALPPLTVKALPSPAPEDFKGAVGSFVLSSKAVPETVAVGDPVTWTVSLNGTGNWGDINSLPKRSVARSFGVIEPQAKKNLEAGKLFDGNLSEDIVLIPKQPGTYKLPAVSMTVFDPASGTYKQLKTQEHTITVTGAAVASTTQASPPPPAATQLGSSAQSASSPQPKLSTETIKPPSNLPLDPLVKGSATSRPFQLKQLLQGLLIFPAMLLILWWALAIRRAYRSDKYLPKRKAKASLRRILETLSENSSALSRDELRRTILNWQKLSTILWSIYKSTPTHLDIPDKEWALLWRESDRILYGPAPALPGDWISRAITALQAKRVPGFNPFRFLLPANLLAFPMSKIAVFVFGLSLLSLGTKVSAEETGAQAQADVNPVLTAYQKADFDTAVTESRKILKQNPTDWAARYNLSLALSQKNEWPEAAAQAAAAFVQNPSNQSIRHQLHYAYLQAGSIPSELQPFLKPKPPLTHQLAARFSPSAWQYFLIGAAALAAIGIAYSLCVAYSARKFGVLAGLLGVPILIIAIIMAAASAISLNAYGKLASPEACLVIKASTLRSIPTELDTPQKTIALKPGHLAMMDKDFLTWNRLIFRNDQSGWVQKDDITPLWK